MTRTIISGGIVVTESSTYQADVIIAGEQIVGTMQGVTLQPSDEIIDAKGCYILPGIIDVHTHIALDTGIYKTADNWHQGTTTAAWGGVTTVIDFTPPAPDGDLVAAVKARREQASDAVIDYNLHAVVTHIPPEGLDAQFEQLVSMGISSIKLFTTYRPNYYLDDAAILKVMQSAARHNLLVMVHCENDSLVSDATQTLVARGSTGLESHGRARPVLAEEEAVNRILYLAEAAKCDVYIVHCSSARSVRHVRSAVQRGVKAFCETCPQYLFLDESEYLGDHPERAILQPPLRDKAQNKGLLRALASGEIDVVSTDHCDYTLAQKRETRDFTRTPGGLPGLETLLPLMITHSTDKLKLSLSGLVRVLCCTPARLFGLDHRKGELRAGMDADVVIYDPSPRHYLHAADLHNVAGYTPYEGTRMRGAVRMVFSRGKKILDDRTFTGTAGDGRFVPAVIRSR
jgi:dihydropyrimidinase